MGMFEEMKRAQVNGRIVLVVGRESNFMGIPFYVSNIEKLRSNSFLLT